MKCSTKYLEIITATNSDVSHHTESTCYHRIFYTKDLTYFPPQSVETGFAGEETV